MVIANLFAEAFLGVILGKTMNKAVDRFLEKPATKVFEDSFQKLKDKTILGNINMKDFLKLCDRTKYPESRRIIESAYQNLDITEQEKGQLFRNFKEIFSGDKESLKIIFEEFLNIFFQEVIENCKNSDWKYWVWMQLKEKGGLKILLESFEEALHFDVREAKWFRGSPFWIDFEKNKIYRRTEIDVIKKKLEYENIQIVYGDAASGKSVIVKYIGYEYCRMPKPVYIINLKTDSLKEYRKDIVNLLNRDVLLIIEDAHLAFHDINWIIKKVSRRKLKVLISTRPVEEKITYREITRFELLMKKKENSTGIRAFNGAEKIVKFYFSQGYTEEKMEEFEILRIFYKYGEDLWLLSFALEAFSLGSGIDMNKVYENIYNKYLKNILVGKNTFIKDSYKYLYPICIFYQYEIPICKDFLLKDLDLNEIYLNRLIESGEILQKGKMLFLHHSSRAKYFLRAMIHYDLHKQEEEYEIIKRHFKSFSEFNCDIINKTIKFPFQIPNIINELLLDEETPEIIGRGIDATDNLEAIGDCLPEITWINRNVAKAIVETMDIEKLIKKIDNATSLSDIGICLSGISKASKKEAREIFKKIDRELIIKKIKKSDDLWHIDLCLSGISKASKKEAREIFKKIDRELIIKKIKKSDDLWKIGDFFLTIARFNMDAAKRFTEIIEIEWFIEKLYESDIMTIGNFLLSIKEVNENLAGQLVEKIGIERLKEIVHGEDEVKYIVSGLFGIEKVNRDIGRKLMQIFASEIEMIYDLYSFVDIISDFNLNRFNEFKPILRLFKRKIERICDLNLKNIGFTLSSVAETNENLARELIPIIAMKIDEAYELWDIKECFLATTRGGRNAMKELTQVIDKEKLIKKIDEADNLGEIRQFFLRIADFNENFLRELLGSMNKEKLAEKINKAEKLWEIGILVSIIEHTNENMLKELLKEINIEKIAEKINKADRLWEIHKCFLPIKRVRRDSAHKILKLLTQEKRDKILQS